jgi:[ribosomal protein S18]-alanine N-acetyltransferase
MRRLDAPPIPQFQLRKMELGDLPAVMDIERAAFKSPWSAELLKRELSHEWSTILVAEQSDPLRGEQLLGLVIFWLVHDEIHILNVATSVAHRRRGVGRTLIAAALERGRQHRCALATLEVRRSNLAALKLYEGFGFRSVGVRPNYYVDEGEDAIVMVLDL